MKNSQKWAILFTVINIALIAVCCVLLLGKDRKAPVIAFSENDLIYYSGIDEGQLLNGVTATDNSDGDITDRIVVEKIVQDPEASRVVVYYAVMDRDGNVTKASRVFEAVDEETGDVRKDIGMAGIDGELDTAMQTGAVSSDAADDGMLSGNEAVDGDETAAATDQDDTGEASEDQDEETASENEDEEEARRQQELIEEQKKQEAEQRQREQEAEEQRQREAEEEAQRAREAEEAAKAGNPKIHLKSTTVNTVAGQLPAWVNVIGSFEDDTDGYETLFKNLKASKYDVNAKGDHKVSLTTTDSDGNASDPVTVTVHVK